MFSIFLSLSIIPPFNRPDEFNPRRFIGADGRVEAPEYFLPFQVRLITRIHFKLLLRGDIKKRRGYPYYLA